MGFLENIFISNNCHNVFWENYKMAHLQEGSVLYLSVPKPGRPEGFSGLESTWGVGCLVSTLGRRGALLCWAETWKWWDENW